MKDSPCYFQDLIYDCHMNFLKKIKLHIILPSVGFLFMLFTNPEYGGLFTHGFISAGGFGVALGYMIFVSVGTPLLFYGLGRLAKKNFIEGTKNWIIILSAINIITYSYNIFYPAYFG